MFLEKELRGLSPSSYIHVSVSDLYIPMIGLPILLQENRWTDRDNIYIAHRTEGTVTFFIRTFFIRNKVYTNFLYTGQSSYGYKVYTGTKFLWGQSFYRDKVYTGTSFYRTEAAQFLFWEYRKSKFLCSVRQCVRP